MFLAVMFGVISNSLIMEPSNTINETSVHHEPSDRKRRLLIIDDDTLVSWALGNALTKVGYDVSIVESGEKAISIISSQSFDLLITDIELPNINGFELTRLVKNSNPNIPVIGMSALDEYSQCELLSQMPFDRFVEKPFNMREIIQLIQCLLHGYESPQTEPNQEH